ncbi:hypothetical protein [Bosea sp. NBC_00550]|uniref:hypothetical protein n=1 Tax=Bosea sp. NBC_00550 TaxID=2969621 RepID=UPI002230A76D|nr:hypothetical protein [Bosea sp. NBC_00550]UZF93016.1 hypothetical protein NWE53_02020 [Bosea sp. NBC_00550]
MSSDPKEPIYQFTAATVVDQGKAATKLIEIEPDGTVRKTSYDTGATYWRLKEIDEPDHQAMAAMLRRLSTHKRICLLAGAPLPHVDLAVPNYRRSNNADPSTNTLCNAPRACLVIDIDGAAVPDGLGHGERIAEAASWLRDNCLPASFKGVTAIAIPSSSTGLYAAEDGTWTKAWLKLFFLLDRAHPLEALYRWARGAKIAGFAVDPAVLLPSQPIYVSRPVFVNCADPVPPELHAVVIDGPVSDRVTLDVQQFETPLVAADAWSAKARADTGSDWHAVLDAELGGEQGFFQVLTVALGLAAKSAATDEEITATIKALLTERADRDRQNEYDRSWVLSTLRRFRAADHGRRARIEAGLSLLLTSPAAARDHGGHPMPDPTLARHAGSASEGAAHAVNGHSPITVSMAVVPDCSGGDDCDLPDATQATAAGVLAERVVAAHQQMPTSDHANIKPTVLAQVDANQPEGDADTEYEQLAAEYRVAEAEAEANPYAGHGCNDLITIVQGLDHNDPALVDRCKRLIDAAIAARFEPLLKGRVRKALAVKLGITQTSVREQWETQEKAWAKANVPKPDEIEAQEAEEKAAAAEARQTEAAGLWTKVSPLAVDPALMDRLRRFVADAGVVGEQAGAVSLFLTLVSRLLPDRGLCLLRRGAASSGKNHLPEIMLKMMPEGDVITASGGSPKSLPYMGGADNRGALAHKVLYIPEAASIAPRGSVENDNTIMLRTLISEGRIVYQVVVTRQDGPPETVEIVKDGPIAVVLTSARNNIEAELLTRLVLADTDESAALTERVCASILKRATQRRLRSTVAELELWRDYHRWLALGGPYDVVVPFARAIGVAYGGMAVPLRVRRDINSILAAIKASAIAHKAQRAIDGDGCIIATLDDYRHAWTALAGGLAAVYKPQVSAGVMTLVRTLEAMLAEAVAARKAKVAEHHKAHGPGASLPHDLRPVTTVIATVRQIMARLGIASRDTVASRIEAALTSGVLEVVNPTAPRNAPREYRVRVSSTALRAQIAGSAAMPAPDAVAALVADPDVLEAALAQAEAAALAAPEHDDATTETMALGDEPETDDDVADIV